MGPWIWQSPDWPRFTWQPRALAAPLRAFAQGLADQGVVLKQAPGLARTTHRTEWLTDEAVRTSEIEGVVLDRDSVRNSILRRMGLRPGARKQGAEAEGVAEMMVSLHNTFDAPLDHETLCRWHVALLAHDPRIEALGSYRRDPAPMQVVSGPIGRATVHYEAPPSKRVPAEMDRFIKWFNKTTASSEDGAPERALAQAGLQAAGLAHLYFESIHPFEDGNGRIGRAIAEKALARTLAGQPGPALSLTPLSAGMCRERKDYYEALNRETGGARPGAEELDVTPWLEWFCGMAVRAQQRGHRMLACVLAQAKFMEAHKNRANPRQVKTVFRLFDAEHEQGFKGGLSAKNHQSITAASESEAQRDLAELVDWGVLLKTGQGQPGDRYALAVPEMDELLARALAKEEPDGEMDPPGPA